MKIKNINKNGHIKFYEFIINSLSKNKKISLSIDEGLKSLKIVNSIYKSSKMNSTFSIEKIKDTFLGEKYKNGN